MKTIARTVMMAVAILSTAVSCKKTDIVEVEVPVIVPVPEKVALSSSSLSMPADGGVQSVTVASEGEWTLYGECSWCTPSATCGTGGDEVSFVADVNIMSAREAEFTFVCGNMIARLSVAQEDAGRVPYDELWYTTIDGNPVELNRQAAGTVNILSNTYRDGKGIISSGTT